jgi:hypothetical protein
VIQSRRPTWQYTVTVLYGDSNSDFGRDGRAEPSPGDVWPSTPRDESFNDPRL